MARIQLVLREQSCCVGSLQKFLGPTCACACSCAMYTRGVPVVLDGTQAPEAMRTVKRFPLRPGNDPPLPRRDNSV